ncbi:6-phosphogluconolactonase [Nocardioides humilatus]|uniref:6-phosphogluconolactonase n=1 Tax=Nocardioides humilatus TaxID=2607660 RepID=A0A5B1L953_9ACTN|nr:6-phosphogluconolactonase [Nocardioides humilatus]KAA1417115.1 6-phosphogluconolactonase [Nocardioides humilatus]
MTGTDSLPEPHVEVHADAAALATAVAGELLNRIADSQAAGHVPAICLTGGTIADAIHREVARMAPESGVDWGAVDFWFGDERYVDRDSPDRNAVQARDAFLDVLGVPPHRVHEMPSPSSARSVDEAARSYGAELRGSAAHEFLVTMLGVGPDGHIASLFPGFSQLTAHDIAVGVTGSPKPPPHRVTLTLEALAHSAAVWFLVSGDAKADAVRRALAEDGTVAETPARGVRGTAETTWFLDHDAASLL